MLFSSYRDIVETAWKTSNGDICFLKIFNSKTVVKANAIEKILCNASGCWNTSVLLAYIWFLLHELYNGVWISALIFMYLIKCTPGTTSKLISYTVSYCTIRAIICFVFCLDLMLLCCCIHGAWKFCVWMYIIHKYSSIKISFECLFARQSSLQI